MLDAICKAVGECALSSDKIYRMGVGGVAICVKNIKNEEIRVFLCNMNMNDGIDDS